jgi:hypothetical protein
MKVLLICAISLFCIVGDVVAQAFKFPIFVPIGGPKNETSENGSSVKAEVYDMDSLKRKRGEPQTLRSAKVQRPSVDYEALSPHIWHITVSRVEVFFPDGQMQPATDAFSWWGTGFLLDDGRFITSRQVVEPWVNNDYIKYEAFAQANKVVNNGGKVVVHFLASSSYDNVQWRFTNEDFIIDRSRDRQVGNERLKMSVLWNEEDDWAYMSTNRAGGLSIDASASVTLEKGSELAVIGFPYDLDSAQIKYPKKVQPLLRYAHPAVKGLTRGIVMAADPEFERGMAGAPVFIADKKGNRRVVGIVSAGIKQDVGYIVPVSSVK